MNNQWVSISSGYPSSNEGVLVTDGKSITAAALSFVAGSPYEWVPHGLEYDDAEFFFRKNFNYGDITFWMPFPSLPRGEE